MPRFCLLTLFGSFFNFLFRDFLYLRAFIEMLKKQRRIRLALKDIVDAFAVSDVSTVIRSICPVALLLLLLNMTGRRPQQDRLAQGRHHRIAVTRQPTASSGKSEKIYQSCVP